LSGAYYPIYPIIYVILSMKEYKRPYENINSMFILIPCILKRIIPLPKPPSQPAFFDMRWSNE
jgi:hypothetical protein